MGKQHTTQLKIDQFAQQQDQEVSFQNWESDAELLDKIKTYARKVVESDEYALDIDFDMIVEWKLGSMKTRAGQVKRMKNKWGRYDVGERMETNCEIERYGETVIKFSRIAMRKMEEDEIKSTIRHELIHVWQAQNDKESGHGMSFERKAEKLGCDQYCDKFTEYKYTFRCSECGDIVGGKHRNCKRLRQARKGLLRTRCCNADINVEE